MNKESIRLIYIEFSNINFRGNYWIFCAAIPNEKNCIKPITIPFIYIVLNPKFCIITTVNFSIPSAYIIKKVKHIILFTK